jgi:hypothetical protein
MKKLALNFSLALIVFLAACNSDEAPRPINPKDMSYMVDVNPADFISSSFTGNNYFPLVSGSTFTSEGLNEDDEEVIVIEEHLSTTKEILGVTCFIIHVEEYEGGELVEDTYDWYAQDLEGNVWYFGEDSNEIEGGEIVSKEGSWESGQDGALPGIIMFANPISGLWYRQEYYKGEAEDVAQVLSLNESITVPYGTFTNCLQTAEWSTLNNKVIEHKYYAPGVGMLRAVAVKGEKGFEDLTDIQ